MLWEILVPDADYGLHKDVERFIIDLVGGFTVYNKSIGNWIDPYGNTVQDIITPYRIKCLEKDIKLIARYVKARAKQYTVMYYLVSNNVQFI